MIKAVLFDVDGTLLDSFPTIYRCLNVTLKTFKIGTIKRERLRTLMDYLSFKEIILKLADIYQFSDVTKISTMEKYYISLFKHTLARDTRPYPDIYTMLKSLKQRYILGIISYNMSTVLDTQIKIFKLHSYFSYIKGYEEINGHKRYGIQTFSKQFNIESSDIIYVGDQPKDIVEAKLAGAKSIAVTYGISDYQTLLREAPDYTVTAPLEILTILK